MALHGKIFAWHANLHGAQLCMQRNSEQTSSCSKKDMLHPTDLSWHCILPDTVYQSLMQQVNIDCRQEKSGVHAADLHVFAQLHALG